eukprot:364630-Chlamydomonas_euryale.AAC.17
MHVAGLAGRDWLKHQPVTTACFVNLSGRGQVRLGWGRRQGKYLATDAAADEAGTGSQQAGRMSEEGLLRGGDKVVGRLNKPGPVNKPSVAAKPSLAHLPPVPHAALSTTPVGVAHCESDIDAQVAGVSNAPRQKRVQLHHPLLASPYSDFLFIAFSTPHKPAGIPLPASTR